MFLDVAPSWQCGGHRISWPLLLSGCWILLTEGRHALIHDCHLFITYTVYWNILSILIITSYVLCSYLIYIYYIFSFLDLSQNMSSCLIHVHISLQFFTLGLEPLGVRVRRSAPISHCWCSIKSQWRRTRQKMDWLLFNESWSSYSWYSLYREMLYTKMCIYTYIYNI